jgi:thiamine biosynthesis lipoprotein
VSGVYVHTIAPMGTIVTIQVVGHDETEEAREARADCVSRAAAWFEGIESACSRFDPASELRQLCAKVGAAVAASPMLFDTIRFALKVAEDSDGAFDPTVGRRMEARGFDRHHVTGERANSGAPGAGGGASWRDVELDTVAHTVTLHRPLTLDLGAVAKGLAVDMAARELTPFENFAVNAGGDVYLGGHNADGARWSVGVRDPRGDGLIETLCVSDTAVCTSGDYERRSPNEPGAHHIMDARSGDTASRLASVTVVAPSALVADACATAAFALGPEEGARFLERHGLRGILVTPSRERIDIGAAI